MHVSNLQLENKNQALKEEMEKLYEKDDVFMASLRRQNTENDNFIKLLQSDIQSITIERFVRLYFIISSVNFYLFYFI